MPAGTQAAILRAVLHERYPKHALPAIASRFAVNYAELRAVLDRHGYPDPAKMRTAASDLELEDQADSATDGAPSKPAVNPFDPAQTSAEKGAEKLGGDPGAGTYEGPRTVIEPPTPPTDGPQDDPQDETGQLMRVKVNDLQADPENLRVMPRLDEPTLIDLADSISELGLLQPITARRHQGRLVVVMGHRRLQAVRRLKWTTVPVIVRGPMLAADVIAAMLVENGQRKDLNPLEEARGLKLLKAGDGAPDSELSDVEVARRIGRSQPYVSNRLALLSLSAADQAAIVAGDMTMVEGTAKGRLNSGRVNRTGQDKNWHLGPFHDLALSAKARCARLDHPRGRRVGGMACGECWESVIRADARQDFVDISQRSGTCAICDQPVERQVEPMAAGR